MASIRASPAASAVIVPETSGGLAEDDERDPEQGGFSASTSKAANFEWPIRRSGSTTPIRAMARPARSNRALLASDDQSIRFPRSSEIGLWRPDPPQGCNPKQLQRQAPEKRRRAATGYHQSLPCSVDVRGEHRHKQRDQAVGRGGQRLR